jgi:hypothetical protein
MSQCSTSVFSCPAEGQPVTHFVQALHKKFPWKQKSVLSLIITRDEKFFLLCRPRKVCLRDSSNYHMTPVQGKVWRKSTDPTYDSSKILRDKAGISLTAEQMRYVGYGLTDGYRNNNTLVADGKILHVVVGMFGQTKFDIPPTDYSSDFQWISISALGEYMTEFMSPKKATIIEEALLNLPEKSHRFRAKNLQAALF